MQPEKTTDPRSERLASTLDQYLSGDSGIPFEVLSRFAEPIFDLYEIDPKACISHRTSGRQALELSLMVAVLDTARLFWTWFLLDEEESRRTLPVLERHLIGSEPSVDEQGDFLELISIMRDRWNELALEGLARHYDLAPFQEVARTFSGEEVERTSETGPRFGPDALELPEALALFARPMLEVSGVMDDPDLLDDALARAQAYWELAQSPESERPARLDAIKRRFTRDGHHANVIEQEARRMLARFRELFPEFRPK